jgi:carboxymethylenebutenolidase
VRRAAPRREANPDTMSSTISVTSADGRPFEAYLALPPSGPAPAIVIVPSIFGVTDDFKTSLDRYASKGFIVIAPDVFWRTHPGPLTMANFDAAQARMKAYKFDEGLDDLKRSVDALKSVAEWNGKFGIFGFCFGGKHAILGITRLGADAGASFHGTQMHTVLDEVVTLDKPFSFHYGEDDHVVPMEQVDAIKAAFAGKDGEIYVYPGVGHSFALPDNPSYHAEATRTSEDRALAIFSRMKDPAIA